MTIQLQQEMDRLKKHLLQLVAMVEKNLRDSVKALENSDGKLAERVVEQDRAVDDLEVMIEEDCMKILAKYQPVANDLRFIIACLKINNDLERIGDQAANIAERAEYLSGKKEVPKVKVDLHEMVEITKSMVHDSLTALLNEDVKLAHNVRTQDDAVDKLNRDMFSAVRKGIKNHPEHIRSYMNLLSASRHLERVADHACNIAEDVIYMVEGEIVRHQAEDDSE